MDVIVGNVSAGEYCTKGKTSDCAPLTGMGVRVKRIAGVGVKAGGRPFTPTQLRAFPLVCFIVHN